jgi:glycogen phosphorylase
MTRKLGWDQAWDLTQRTLGYTNHTLLPGSAGEVAGRRGSRFCCRAISKSSMRSTAACSIRSERGFPAMTRDACSASALIEEGPTKHVRMANLAIVGSHSTNGVAAIHSELLRKTTVKDLAEMFPERFNNKTNGVTPRRWLLLANPASRAP